MNELLVSALLGVIGIELVLALRLLRLILTATRVPTPVSVSVLAPEPVVVKVPMLPAPEVRAPPVVMPQLPESTSALVPVAPEPGPPDPTDIVRLATEHQVRKEAREGKCPFTKKQRQRAILQRVERMAHQQGISLSVSFKVP